MSTPQHVIYDILDLCRVQSLIRRAYIFVEYLVEIIKQLIDTTEIYPPSLPIIGQWVTLETGWGRIVRNIKGPTRITEKNLRI